MEHRAKGLLSLFVSVLTWTWRCSGREEFRLLILDCLLWFWFYSTRPPVLLTRLKIPAAFRDAAKTGQQPSILLTTN